MVSGASPQLRAARARRARLYQYRGSAGPEHPDGRPNRQRARRPPTTAGARKRKAPMRSPDDCARPSAGCSSTTSSSTTPTDAHERGRNYRNRPLAEYCGAMGALRTFIAALRRCLEPGRPPRQASRLLVTDGPGHALRAGRDAVDAWRSEDAAAEAAAAPPGVAVALWDAALARWRGPVLADFPHAAWAAAERVRLEALRLDAVEGRADALLVSGAARDAVADLEAHLDHPEREHAWVLLVTALERSGLDEHLRRACHRSPPQERPTEAPRPRCTGRQLHRRQRAAQDDRDAGVTFIPSAYAPQRSAMSRTKDSSWPECTKPRAGLQPREVTTAWAMPYMH
ncbi:BTAD domain-containing putative transcriptional regulator [Streptomyces longwoodensis]|uniref:AfsR/SARP family transcriptional regulator n=1 Tax=Streptomyces longwoodensis TaxID=68231 RepID=UPI0033D802BC